MHRSISRSPLRLGGVVAALIALTWPALRGQEPSAKPAPLIVATSGMIKLQMTTKKPIKTVTNPKENAITIKTVVGDPTTIFIFGQNPDITRIELEDTDGNKETYEVIVQTDIEYLRSQIKRAVPTANVQLIPTGGTKGEKVVIMSGTVTQAEDVAIIRGVAESVGFKYIDGIRVGGVQQVQLDVIVAEVSREDLRNLAFNFLGQGSNFFGGSTVGNAVSQPAIMGGGGGAAPFSSGGLLTSQSGSPNGSPTNLLLGLVHNTWGLQNFLQALKQNSLAKLLAEPRLVTLSGRPASFLVGGQQAVPTSSGLGTIGIQFVPFGTQLAFVPIVLGNGRIHLEVMPTVSNLDQAAGTSLNGAPVAGRSMNMVNTTIELESGQTFVIGGLIQHTVQASISRVPFLGDLPYLGMFFSSKSYQATETEVVVIVTPWLVDAESCEQRPKLLPGDETRRPDNFELFLEGLLEAPRGPRLVKQNHHYVPAWKNSPSAAVFPCPGNGMGCGGSACGGCNPVNAAGPAGAPGTLASAPAEVRPPSNDTAGPRPMPAGGEETASPPANDPSGAAGPR